MNFEVRCDSLRDAHCKARDAAVCVLGSVVHRTILISDVMTEIDEFGLPIHFYLYLYHVILSLLTRRDPISNILEESKA